MNYPPRSALGRLICWWFDRHAWMAKDNAYLCHVCGERRHTLLER